MMGGSMLFAHGPKAFCVPAHSLLPDIHQLEAVSIQAGGHLLSRQGLEVVDVETLGGEDGLHVCGDKLVVELRSD